MHTANRKMVNGIASMIVVVLLELMHIISLLMMKTLTNCDMQFEKIVANEVGHRSLLFLSQCWRLIRAVFGGLTSNLFCIVPSNHTCYGGVQLVVEIKRHILVARLTLTKCS